MEHVDYCIIGGGIVGLATAYQTRPAAIMAPIRIQRTRRTFLAVSAGAGAGVAVVFVIKMLSGRGGDWGWPGVGEPSGEMPSGAQQAEVTQLPLRGANMITATPSRQITEPMMSQRSGRNPSKSMAHASEPATKTPP